MIREDVIRALSELFEKAGRPTGGLCVIGCSTSEIAGSVIGKMSAPEIGAEVAEAALDFAVKNGVYMAFQCCEHLNRALVVPRGAIEKFGLAEVWVLPMPTAGGSCAAAAFELMEDPVVVENVHAGMAMDIGDTLIGMHMRPVAVPLRLSINQIGNAHLTAAYSRPKLIGGERAKYK